MNLGKDLSLKGSAEWTCWGAVAGVSGDEKAVGMKVDGEELKVVGIEGEVVETRKLLERANQRVEAVKQATIAHDKKNVPDV